MVAPQLLGRSSRGGLLDVPEDGTEGFDTVEVEILCRRYSLGKGIGWRRFRGRMCLLSSKVTVGTGMLLLARDWLTTRPVGFSTLMAS